MRPLWLDLRAIPVQKRIGYLRAAREANVEAALVSEETMQGFDLPIVVLTSDGALVRDGKPVGRLPTVRDAASARLAADAEGIALVAFDGWQVIPLETLVVARRSRPASLFALAATPQQAGLFANVLETGVHGVALAAQNPGDILEARRLLDQAASAPAAVAPTGRIETAKVTEVADGGLADRVCLDATTAFEAGQGLAIGATAASLALVHAETLSNGHIEPRAFRVNAGALHHYALAPGGTTRYLSEAASGTILSRLDAQGRQSDVTLGRCKIERRPHTLVRWLSPSGPGHAFLQTAETVNLVTPDGAPRAVTQLKPGDSILVWAQHGARHTGQPVDGEVVER